MKRTSLAVVILLISADPSFAQVYLEADLNGVVGDPQPDYIVTTVGQEIPVDLWIFGPKGSGCWYFGMFLCGHAPALEYSHLHYYSPGGGWDYNLPDWPEPGCVTVQGVNFHEDIPMLFPWRIATVTYRAAVDQSIAELRLGEGSGVLDLSWVTSSFLNNGGVLARVQIGDVTATEQTSWGSIKILFR